jgi:hypothetical protein
MIELKLFYSKKEVLFFCFNRNIFNDLPQVLKTLISSIETCLCRQAGTDDAENKVVHRFTRITFIMKYLYFKGKIRVNQ